MKQLKNFLIKREQSQACLSFAKREKSRLLAKTILTLVALLAVTTGAWAQGKLIYEKVFTSDTQYPFYLDAADKTGASATVSGGMLVLNNPTIQTQNWDVQPEIGRLTSATPITKGNTYRVVIYYKTTAAGGVTFALGGQDWTNTDWKGQSITVSDDFQTCEGYFDSFPYSNSESHILLQFGSLVTTITIKKVEVYELYPFTGITWDAAKKTATIAEMPTGNVSVTPEYYPQAAFATGGAPTAINDVPATTDGAIVKPGTVADIPNIPEVIAQGTVMYYVSQTAMTDAQLLALAADDWKADVPTAEKLTKGPAYVYYYIRGNDSQLDDEIFSDGDILAANALQVTIAAEPTYNVTFAEDTPEPDKWTASPNADVKKGQTVTVTYTGSKKVLGVKAEKKAAPKLLEFEPLGVKFYYYEGETWGEAIRNHPENQADGWYIEEFGITVMYKGRALCDSAHDDDITEDTVVNPNGGYLWGPES